MALIWEECNHFIEAYLETNSSWYIYYRQTQLELDGKNWVSACTQALVHTWHAQHREGFHFRNSTVQSLKPLSSETKQCCLTSLMASCLAYHPRISCNIHSDTKCLCRSLVVSVSHRNWCLVETPARSTESADIPVMASPFLLSITLNRLYPHPSRVSLL